MSVKYNTSCGYHQVTQNSSGTVLRCTSPVVANFVMSQLTFAPIQVPNTEHHFLVKVDASDLEVGGGSLCPSTSPRRRPECPFISTPVTYKDKKCFFVAHPWRGHTACHICCPNMSWKKYCPSATSSPWLPVIPHLPELCHRPVSLQWSSSGWTFSAGSFSPAPNSGCPGKFLRALNGVRLTV